ANREWMYLCGKCHDELGHLQPNKGPHDMDLGGNCDTCHPGSSYRPCTECHYHGNTEIDGSPYNGGEHLF
ncbi:MAG: hypothetical protein SVR08_12940, partial [Spirochaetota bacterium]|nr:hypothetical protein [Spirochaetota bacterium]